MDHRASKVPGALVKAERNVIALRVVPQPARGYQGLAAVSKLELAGGESAPIPLTGKRRLRFHHAQRYQAGHARRSGVRSTLKVDSFVSCKARLNSGLFLLGGGAFAAKAKSNRQGGFTGHIHFATTLMR